MEMDLKETGYERVNWVQWRILWTR